MVEVALDTPANPDAAVGTIASSKKRQERMQSVIIAAKFGDMVTILMQTKQYEQLQLKDLRSYIVPPLMNNQYRLAEAHKKGSGSTVPAGLILWARVSQEVHDRMAGALDAPFILAPDEWTSGDNYWIVDAIGQQRFLAPLLTDLRNTDLKGKTVNYRVRTPNGPELKTFPDDSADDSAPTDAG